VGQPDPSFVIAFSQNAQRTLRLRPHLADDLGNLIRGGVAQGTVPSLCFGGGVPRDTRTSNDAKTLSEPTVWDVKREQTNF
jgi:hypothetical protein